MLDAAKCYMLVNPVSQLWRLQEHIQEVKIFSKLTNSSQYSGHEIDLPWLLGANEASGDDMVAGDYHTSCCWKLWHFCHSNYVLLSLVSVFKGQVMFLKFSFPFSCSLISWYVVGCEISRVLILCCLSFLIQGDLYCKFREFPCSSPNLQYKWWDIYIYI